MTTSDLPLGLSRESIAALAGTWSDGGLWDDIVWLALLAWTAGDGQEHRMRWHHLVMAVGNFKRQGGRRLRPDPVSPVSGLVAVTRADHFPVPGLERPLERDDLASWQLLNKSLAGAGIATTTTLLAALWPEKHHVFDWRVAAAVAGLGVASAGQGNLELVDALGRDSAPQDLPVYAKVRQLLLTISEQAELPLLTVERALYKLAFRGAGMTWLEYGHELQRRINQPPTHLPPDDDGELNEGDE